MMKENRYTPYFDNSIKTCELTEFQKQFLTKLNQFLAVIEQNIKKQAQAVITDCRSKVDDKYEWADDYEAYVKITFFLNEKDPAYDENIDNILVELTENIKDTKFKFNLADGCNHNEFQNLNGHVMKDDKHCWLYHCLYDHTALGWENILRIGCIGVDIHFGLQHYFVHRPVI